MMNVIYAGKIINVFSNVDDVLLKAALYVLINFILGMISHAHNVDILYNYFLMNCNVRKI